MRKEYIEPEMETFELQGANELLFASGVGGRPSDDSEENNF